jgi:hypothetical protein
MRDIQKAGVVPRSRGLARAGHACERRGRQAGRCPELGVRLEQLVVEQLVVEQLVVEQLVVEQQLQLEAGRRT